MTQPEITFPPPTVDDPPPFESAVQVEVTNPVNLAQLTDELSKATGHHVTLALTTVEDTQRLSVTPGNLNAAVVKKVVADHRPRDGYELPEEEKTFMALLDKVAQGPVELTDDEMKVAVTGLLRRVNAPGNGRRSGLA
jgi:hypothetical protein